MNDARSPIGRARRIKPRKLLNPQIVQRLNSPHHVVLNEYSTQRDLLRLNGGANARRTLRQRNSHDPELHDLQVRRSFEHDHPRVLVGIPATLQYPHLHRAPVKLFRCHRHVMMMHQQPMVRLRHELRGDNLVLRRLHREELKHLRNVDGI